MTGGMSLCVCTLFDLKKKSEDSALLQNVLPYEMFSKSTETTWICYSSCEFER